MTHNAYTPASALCGRPNSHERRLSENACSFDGPRKAELLSEGQGRRAPLPRFTFPGMGPARGP